MYRKVLREAAELEQHNQPIVRSPLLLSPPRLRLLTPHPRYNRGGRPMSTECRKQSEDMYKKETRYHQEEVCAREYAMWYVPVVVQSAARAVAFKTTHGQSITKISRIFDNLKCK